MDVTKLISGCMASVSAMVQLELRHANILSKIDLVTRIIYGKVLLADQVNCQIVSSTFLLFLRIRLIKYPWLPPSPLCLK